MEYNYKEPLSLRTEPNAEDRVEESIQKESGEHISARLDAQERKKEECLYFKFKTKEQRDAAVSLIRREQGLKAEFDDNFRFLVSCNPNKENDLQIDLTFSKNLQSLHSFFHNLCTKNGFTPTEEYETVDRKPEPEHTVINQ